MPSSTMTATSPCLALRTSASPTAVQLLDRLARQRVPQGPAKTPFATLSELPALGLHEPFPTHAHHYRLFTRVRGSRFSRKFDFALTEFSEVGWVRVCAAFLLQHLLAGASDLHTDEPKGA